MNWGFQRVAIVGSGAIGLYYGGRLAASGEDVHFLVRSDYETISREGLVVESVHGDFKLPQVKAYQTSEEIGPVDLVIVAWKTTANDQLVEILTPLLHSETQVLTLQNGLGSCEALEKIVGHDRVLGGLCFVCINRLSAGHVRHSAGGKVTLGAWGNEGLGRVAELTKRFQMAGISAFAVDKLEVAQWEKLLWNIPFNGLSVAEGGVTTDVLLGSPELVAELRALKFEVIAAANAQGLALHEDLVDFSIERTRPMGPYRTSSMIDFVEGREVEVAPIWEEPLRRALAAGVEMPHLTKLLRRIHERLTERARTRQEDSSIRDITIC